jgi:hypothetical protein
VVGHLVGFSLKTILRKKSLEGGQR